MTGRARGLISDCINALEHALAVDDAAKFAVGRSVCECVLSDLRAALDDLSVAASVISKGYVRGRRSGL
jgi:hypothetical protein